MALYDWDRERGVWSIIAVPGVSEEDSRAGSDSICASESGGDHQGKTCPVFRQSMLLNLTGEFLGGWEGFPELLENRQNLAFFGICC